MHDVYIHSFIILRYSGILATLPSLFFTSVQSQHCQLAVTLSQVGVVLVVGASGVIFCYRVFAIWNGNKIIYAFVGFMYCAMLSCWVSEIVGVRTLVLLNNLFTDCSCYSLQGYYWSINSFWIELPDVAHRFMGSNQLCFLRGLRLSRAHLDTCKTSRQSCNYQVCCRETNL